MFIANFMCARIAQKNVCFPYFSTASSTFKHILVVFKNWQKG